MSCPRLPALLLAAVVCLAAAGCGGSSSGSPSSSTRARARSTAHTAAAGAAARPHPEGPAHPRLLPGATATGNTPFVPAMTVRGQPVAWVARQSGLALLSFSQRGTVLHLHSGTVDAGPVGWRWGPDISSGERRVAIAGFNGGFKLDVGAGGFASHGRVASPLRSGLGSIVTYSDGYTDIGTWGSEVPAHGRHVVTVRQNLALLIDHGRAAANLDCASCWGATLGGVTDPARSALGITADGHLIWAGGEHLTVSALASTLLAAKVVRAVELDINPEWVAAYLYAHHGGHGLAPVQVVPGQPGIPGQLLTPYARDFFVVVAR